MAKRPQKTKGKTKKAAAAPRRARKAAPKTAKKVVKKAAAKKPAARPSRDRIVTVRIPQHITLDLPPVMHDRLKALSEVMDLPMEAVIRQALMEFADTWEDHHRTVAALADPGDRMQVVVKDPE
jgi:hypothetical protein